jgi:acetylornithine deacetylase/succinyl-diaminopimelate desuccinylase-like protein
MHESAEAYLEQHRKRILEQLLDFLRIPSVSTDPERRADVQAGADWVCDRLKEAGPFTVELLATAGHPAVYAEWLGAPGKPTVLVYGHYDVQPPDPLDQWLSAPFAPEIRNERIYARGVSDDKGPVFIPIKVAEAFFATDGRLPINVKLLIEGEEEIGSAHFDDLVRQYAGRLTADYVLSADGAMWRNSEPSITVGSRGIITFDVDVRGTRSDLHSGRHGGAVQNPLHALASLVAGLHRADGTVAVEGFYDGVLEPSRHEREQIAVLGYEEEEYRLAVGAPALYGEQGFGTLERQWLRPTLEVNGLFGGYQGPGSNTVIPATAHAKLSCRLVPGQDPSTILSILTAHIHAHTPPGVTLSVTPHAGAAPAYRIDPEHPALRIAREVLRRRYEKEPVTVFSGGTIPVSETFRRELHMDTVFFSFSTADEDFHAPNEFFRLSRLWDGLAVWADFWRTAGESI